MKIGIKTGEKVRIVTGKWAGQEAVVQKIDKKNKRVSLEGLKLQKIKTKSGQTRELHGTFHLASLMSMRPPAPKEEAPATAAPAQPEEAKPVPEAAKPSEEIPETKVSPEIQKESA